MGVWRIGGMVPCVQVMAILPQHCVDEKVGKRSTRPVHLSQFFRPASPCRRRTYRRRPMVPVGKRNTDTHVPLLQVPLSHAPEASRRPSKTPSNGPAIGTGPGVGCTCTSPTPPPRPVAALHEQTQYPRTHLGWDEQAPPYPSTDGLHLQQRGLSTDKQTLAPRRKVKGCGVRHCADEWNGGSGEQPTMGTLASDVLLSPLASEARPIHHHHTHLG